MKSLASLLLGIALIATSVAEAENQMSTLLRAQTVMITVDRDNGSQDIGSGIVLCQVDDQVFILTAKHVLYGRSKGTENPPGLSTISQVELLFYRGMAPPVVQNDETPGIITMKFPVKDYDVAVLQAPVTTRLLTRMDLGLAMESASAREGELDQEDHQSTGDKRDTVYAVGNFQPDDPREAKSPEAWAIAEGVLLKREPASADSLGLLYHSAPVTKGFSGGPLFSKSGSLIGLSVESEMAESHGHAFPIEDVVLTMDKWLPAACLQSASRLRARAFDAYRRGMQAVSTKDWKEVRKMMREARDIWPWEGGTLHLQGMRYTIYLPHYHYGLALFHEGNGCVEALGEWGQSEAQGAIQDDRWRYGKMKRLQRRCIDVLKRQLQNEEGQKSGGEK